MQIEEPPRAERKGWFDSFEANAFQDVSKAAFWKSLSSHGQNDWQDSHTAADHDLLGNEACETYQLSTHRLAQSREELWWQSAFQSTRSVRWNFSKRSWKHPRVYHQAKLESDEDAALQLQCKQDRGESSHDWRSSDEADTDCSKRRQSLKQATTSTVRHSSVHHTVDDAQHQRFEE